MAELQTDDQTFLELVETTELATALDDGPYWASIEYQYGAADIERPTLRLLQERIDTFVPRGIKSIVIEKGPLPEERC
jgi:hypothetical protein